MNWLIMLLNNLDKMKHIIRTFGLKGSWKWAKKQMLNGKIVRCSHWSGALKLRIDSKENKLLQANFTNTPMYKGFRLWEISNWHISYEDFTDFEVFEWGKGEQDGKKDNIV